MRFRNDGKEFFKTVYFLASKTQTKIYTESKSQVAVRSGETVDVSYFFKPEETGTYNLWFATDDKGNNVIGTDNVLTAAIEAKVNEIISQDLPVTVEFMPKAQAASIVDLSKLPDDASDTLRIIRIGDYDACACIGAHVAHTAEVGTFKILSHDFEDGRWRVRWKVL